MLEPLVPAAADYRGNKRWDKIVPQMIELVFRSGDIAFDGIPNREELAFS